MKRADSLEMKKSALMRVLNLNVFRHSDGDADEHETHNILERLLLILFFLRTISLAPVMIGKYRRGASIARALRDVYLIIGLRELVDVPRVLISI